MEVEIWRNVADDTRKLLEAVARVDSETAPDGLGNRIMSQIRARMMSQETRAKRRSGHGAEPLSFSGVRQVRGITVFSQFCPAAKTVVLVGDFNNWKAEDNPMTRGENGVWMACLRLPPGRYKYRLIVDDRWLQDPHNDQAARNPFGGYDSVVDVPASEAATNLCRFG